MNLAGAECAWCHEGFEDDPEPPLEIKRGNAVVGYVHEGCIRTFLLALEGREMLCSRILCGSLSGGS